LIEITSELSASPGYVTRSETSRRVLACWAGGREKPMRRCLSEGRAGRGRARFVCFDVR
jgi:hypothetical protein